MIEKVQKGNMGFGGWLKSCYFMNEFLIGEDSVCIGRLLGQRKGCSISKTTFMSSTRNSTLRLPNHPNPSSLRMFKSLSGIIFPSTVSCSAPVKKFPLYRMRWLFPTGIEKFMEWMIQWLEIHLFLKVSEEIPHWEVWLGEFSSSLFRRFRRGYRF